MKQKGARCKKCNKPITWLRTRENKWMPVDGHIRVSDGYWDMRMGNHWSTCVHAEDVKAPREPEPVPLQMLAPGEYQVADEPAAASADSLTELDLQPVLVKPGRRIPTVELHIAGSCTKARGPGGWACLLVSGEHRRELTGRLKQTTPIQANWTALLQGLAVIVRYSRIEVYTTCRQISDALQFWSELNLEHLVCARSGSDRTSQMQKAGLLMLSRHDDTICALLEGPIWAEDDSRVHDLARAEAMAAESLFAPARRLRA